MKKKLLLGTPTLTGGSWVVIEDLFPFLLDTFELQTIGLGTHRDAKAGETLKIPYYSFEKVNPKIGRNIYLNILFQIPLQIVLLYKLITYRPDVILSNGFTPIVSLIITAKILKVPIFIYYGSFLEDWVKNKLVLYQVKILGGLVDGVFVNSQLSKNDLKAFVNENKITVVNHSTDFKPFDINTRPDIRKHLGINNKEFVIAYVNRFIPAKGFKTLCELMKISNDIPNLKFRIGGDGIMLEEFLTIAKIRSNIKYLGFIVDREIIKKELTAADLVWTSADETYIVKPAVEALTMGTPIMIPDVAGIEEKYYSKVRLKKTLIPSTVGWIVNNEDVNEIHDLIKDLVENRLTDSMRRNCIDYAHEHYSSKNLLSAVEKLKSYAQ